MPGLPVTIGCAVTLTPGAAGPPDSGMIAAVPQTIAQVSGMPLAVSGSVCQMINSVSGIAYPVVIPSEGCSSGVKIMDMDLIRIGDRIQIGSSILLIIGPPAASFITDSWPP